jgi:hypothetical protein
MSGRLSRVFLLLGLVSAGCSVSRKGTLTLGPAGPVIPVKVSVTTEQVVLEGVHPATGERLRGTLTKVGGERGSQEPWDAGTGHAPPPPGAGGVVSSNETELKMNVAGTLSGDLGTRLRCVAEVERRLYLRGGGTCVAESGGEGAPSYQLKF